jgi:hypothetical protein
VLLAQPAMDANLIDGIKSLEETLQEMANEISGASVPRSSRAQNSINPPPKEKATMPDSNPTATDLTPSNPAASPPPAAAPATTPAPAAAAPAAPVPVAKTGPDFITAYGTQGAVWFAEGKSFEAAGELHRAALARENEELRAKLKAADRGESRPAAFTAAPEKGGSDKAKKASAVDVLADCVRVK